MAAKCKSELSLPGLKNRSKFCIIFILVFDIREAIMRRDKKIIKIIQKLQREEGIFLTLQQDKNKCAPKTILNVLNSLGRPIRKDDEARFFRRANTLAHIFYQKNFDDLASNEEIMRALIEEEGFATSEIMAMTGREAMRKLYKALDSWPVILSVDNASHWIQARAKRIGAVPRIVCITDSQRTIKNLIRTATADLNEKELLKRWRDKRGWFDSKHKICGHYYGIMVKKIG